MIRTNLVGGRGAKYIRDLVRYMRKNYLLLALAAVFLSGVLLGTLVYRGAGQETLDMLSRLIDSYERLRGGQGPVINTVAMVSSSLLYLAVLLVFGFWAVAQPLIVAIPLFRGLGFGFSAASLYAEYGVGAAGFIAVYIFPDMLISSFAILLCCREALRLSGSFWRVMWGGQGGYAVRIYLGRFIAAAVLCIIAAALASALHFAFANYIVLG